MLEINGSWTVAIGKEESIQKHTTVKVFFLNRIESSITKSVANNFRFVSPNTAGGSVSQGTLDESSILCFSDLIETFSFSLFLLTAFHTDHHEQKPSVDKNGNGSSIKIPEMIAPSENLQLLNESFPSVIPQGSNMQLNRNDCRLSLPLQSQTFETTKKLNLSLPIFTGKENVEPNDMKSVEEQAINPNLTYSVVQSAKSTVQECSGHPNTLAQKHSTNPNLTYDMLKTVNPIAAQQSENDLTNCDAIIMDQEEPYNEPKDNRTTIMENVLPIEDDASSGCSFRDDTSVTDDLEYDDDNLGDGNGYDCDNEALNYVCEWPNDQINDAKRIEVIEDITIVPERNQLESMTPMDYLPRTGAVKFWHFSQVDERISANRKEAFNLFSQPETHHERSFIKETPVEWRNVKENVRSNGVMSAEQKSIVVSPPKICSANVDEKDVPTENIRKRSMTPLTPNASQKKFKLSDTVDELSQEKPLRKTQAMSELSFQLPSQNQYETFRPLATSTQRSTVSASSESSYSLSPSVANFSDQESYSQEQRECIIPPVMPGKVTPKSMVVTRSQSNTRANVTSEVVRANTLNHKIDSFK